MKQTVGALLQESIGRNLLEEQGYADLTITFVDPSVDPIPEQCDEETTKALAEAAAVKAEKILENIPTVRILLQKRQEDAA